MREPTLYIFDLDGTLVETYTSEPLPGTLERLEALRDAGFSLAVATNQAGLAWRQWTGKEKYPTVESLSLQFRETAEALPPLMDAVWFVAIHDTRVKLLPEEFEALAAAFNAGSHGLNVRASVDPTWRKPRPGMLEAACEYFGVAPEAALFVGDMETDAEAAEALGTAFAYADAFFDRD